MANYYERCLSGSRLRRCYELAPPRVRQYLAAEIEHVRDRLAGATVVLELGCGYGRVLERLAGSMARVVGIDVSRQSLAMARDTVGAASRHGVAAMNAATLGFRPQSFEAVVCVQNGLAAFREDRQAVLAEAMRVTKPGGRILCSTYADRFWEERVAWFRIQADAGLVGPIDDRATGDGVIVCTDGFRATTIRPEEFLSLAVNCGAEADITEVDGSSVFCEFAVP
jgi:2-polyprenyl-6-hydroxyphenyl methylase/3-demethylubiquinone-9 3-methyltransferase